MALRSRTSGTTFEALNIPDRHPARDPLENFYLQTASRQQDGALLLRSQTSTVQIRVMENTPPPVRVISLGRVYRPDTADATHYPMFHQMEGLLVDSDVTMADLKSVLRMFASSYLGPTCTFAFGPRSFPFTEPSVEADFSWNDDWIEFGGAGMVDPNVLSRVGYDPKKSPASPSVWGSSALHASAQHYGHSRAVQERREVLATVLAEARLGGR